MLNRRLATVCLTVLAASTLAAPAPAGAAAERWGPLREAQGNTLAVALSGTTTALISIGGPHDATVYDQRRTAAGLGPRTAITSVAGAAYCRPVEAATARGNLAVAVECQKRTDLEDPPTRLAELVWTADDGWVSHVQAEGELGSLDYSPRGQYVLFTTNSGYGRPHHLTTYHADLGWRDLARREQGSYGDRLVGAVNDAGDLVALRGAGFEDEPGYWFGGRLRLQTYDATTRTWTQRLDEAYPDGGIDPAGVDLAAGRIVASVVESRSTGELHGLAHRVRLLAGTATAPQEWTTPRWQREVLHSSAAITRAGVGVFGWQSAHGRRTAGAWFATWAPDRATPKAYDLRWRTTLTPAARTGRAMDLSMSPNGHGAIAYVRHRPGADHAAVAGVSFRVGRRGGVSDDVDVTWRQPVDVTVNGAVAAATGSSVTLGRMGRTYYLSPRSRYSIGP
ncbi:hypothetical protein H5V45_06350 [Nocardioides sp. KIGAM211]|uniref:Uncharacterized protein n=1 Tax=Nocardioides luti TaxID=2761101 RepID=A0A7X0VB93_9ACTN|nr:hypothetical protein [Nocardioides luti]MBB6626938.1 hypothetical protein [Nocardioides luti]